MEKYTDLVPDQFFYSFVGTRELTAADKLRLREMVERCLIRTTRGVRLSDRVSSDILIETMAFAAKIEGILVQ